MNTRHAVTKLQGYNKVPPDRANYKVENDISENGHYIEHLHDEVKNAFIIMKDNAIKLGDAYYNIWSKYTGFTSLRSGHLIDEIHPPNRKVYDIENNVFDFEKGLMYIIEEQLEKNQVKMVNNGVVLANNYHSNLDMIDKVGIQEVNKREEMIKNLESKVADLSENLLDRQTKITNLEKDLETKINSLVELNKELTITKNTLEGTNQTVEERNKTISDRDKEIIDLNNTILNEEKRYQDLEKTLEETKQKSYKDLKAKMEEIIMLQTDILYWKNKSKVLDNSDKEWRERLSKLTDDIKKLNTQITSLNKIIENKDNTIKNLQEDQVSKENDIQEKLEEIRKLNLDSVILNDNLETSKKKVIELENDLETKLANCDEQQVEIDKQKQNITLLNNQMNSLSLDKTTLETQINNFKINYKDYINRENIFLIEEWIPKINSSKIKITPPENYPTVSFSGCLFERTGWLGNLMSSSGVYQNREEFYAIFYLFDYQGPSKTYIIMIKVLYRNNTIGADWYDARWFNSGSSIEHLTKSFEKDKRAIQSYYDNGSWAAIATNNSQNGYAISHVHGSFSVNVDDIEKVNFSGNADPKLVLKNENLNKDISKLQNTNVSLTQTVDSLKNDIEELKKQSENKQQGDAVKAQKELDELKSQLQKKDQIILDKTSEIDKLKNDIESNNIKITKLEKDLSDTTRAMDSYKDLYEQTEKKLEKAESGSDDKKWREIYRQRYLEGREKIKKLETEIETLKNENTTLKSSISNSQGDSGKILKEQEELKKKINELTSSLSNKEKEEKRLKGELDYFMEELYFEQQKTKKNNLKVEELEEKIKLQEDKMKAQTSLLSTDDTKTKELEAKISTLTNSVNSEKNKYNTLNTQYNELFNTSNKFLIDRWISKINKGQTKFPFNSRPKFIGCIFEKTGWTSTRQPSQGCYQDFNKKYVIFWYAYSRGSAKPPTTVGMYKMLYDNNGVGGDWYDVKWSYSDKEFIKFVTETNNDEPSIDTLYNSGSWAAIANPGESSVGGYGISNIYGYYY